jgi:Ras-related protein Rab-23
MTPASNHRNISRPATEPFLLSTPRDVKKPSPHHRRRSAGAAVLVFSTTDRASFEAIEEWKRKVEDVCGPIVMCVCQNKVDMIDESAVSPEEAEDLCRGLGLKFYRVCVKENFNVDNVFDYLVRQWSDCDRELVAAQAPAMDIREIARQTEIDRGEAVVSGAADAIASPGGKKAPAEPGHFVAPGMRHKGKKKKDEPGGEAFKLEPTKRRTGGKKSYSSRLKKSCVVS